MSLTRRFLGPIAIQDEKNKVISVDLASLLLRLFLFETCIVHSVWLEDIELLIEVFGTDGMILLFQEGALKVYCESYAIGETGRARADLNFTDNNKRLPLSSYAYSVIRVKDQDERIRLKLEKLASSPSLPVTTRAYLADEIEKNLILMPDSFSKVVFDGFYGDLRSRPDVVKIALEIELKRLGIKPKYLRVRVEETAPEDFRIDSNMAIAYGLSDMMTHKIGDRALMAVASLNAQIALMMTHSSMCGLNDSDLPLLQGKLSLLGALTQSSNDEHRFSRVAQLTGLPVPKFGQTKLDAAAILKIRNSDDCRAFRDWLGTIDAATDEELEERLAGVGATIRSGLNSTYGKVMRFIISNGLQLATGLSLDPVLGTLANVGIGAVDTFLVERLAPRDGIISFLGTEYPSVFKRS
jgi:hypothetical protein